MVEFSVKEDINKPGLNKSGKKKGIVLFR